MALGDAGASRHTGVTVLFAGGGTGGHVYPGLAVIDALQDAFPEVRVAWVGTPDRIEARIVPSHGVPYHPLSVRYLKGTRGAQRLVAAAMLPVAVLRSLRQVVQTRARVIVALGGFVCGPVALAGWMLGRRVVLLEQNAVPGWTGRWIGRFATRVYASFPGTERWYPAGRVVVSGNPVRARLVRDVEALRAVQPSPSERVRRVLVFGGSQGARSLNLVLPATMMRAIEGMGWDVRVRHVAGPGNGADVARAWRDAGASLSDDATDTSRGGAVAVTVDEYVDDMAAAYATADLVVCRAGATSLAELAALGLPSVLIPFPWAADDHQTANARAFEEAGAARSVSDAAIDADETVGLLRDLLSDAQVLGVMGESARTLARSDAAEWLATEIARAAGVDEALDSRGPEHGTTTAAQHGEAR